MEDKNNLHSQDSSSPISIVITVVGLLLAIVGLIYSIAPLFGAFAFPFGIVGVLVSALSIKKHIKLGRKKLWSIVGLVLSFIISAISFINYLNHQNAVNVILGIQGVVDKDQAYEDALIIPEGSPLRNIVIDDQRRKREALQNQGESVKKARENSKSKSNENKSESTPPIGPAPNDGTIKRGAPLSSYYYSLVDNLRIRSAPNTDGKVSFRLRFGQQVEYLGEKSDQKEKITIAGIERNDHWYKICLPHGSRPEGWVYGGALINANKEFSKEQAGLIKPINFIYKDSISKLIGRETYGNYTYTGLVSYKEKIDGKSIPDGRFYFDGYSDQGYEGMPRYGETERVRGSLIDGALHGVYREVIGLFETSITLDIEYENGVCKSYKMISNAEGEIEESESSNPEDCSFDFIDGKLRPVN